MGPSFLGLSPDPEVTEQKSYGVYHFPGKTREKGIRHRSGKKGIHHRASDPVKEKKEGLHGGGVYFFLPCFGGFPTGGFVREANLKNGGRAHTGCNCAHDPNY